MNIIKKLFNKEYRQNHKCSCNTFYYGIVDEYGNPVEIKDNIKIISIDVAKLRENAINKD